MVNMLVKLELEELPEYTSDSWWEYRISKATTRKEHDSAMEEYQLFRKSYNCVELVDSEFISNSELQLGGDFYQDKVNLLNKDGYVKVNDYESDIGDRYEKRITYKFSNEVKSIIENLTMEKTQKIRTLSSENESINKMLLNAEDEYNKLQCKVNNATIWSRVKFLFRGEL